MWLYLILINFILILMIYIYSIHTDRYTMYAQWYLLLSLMYVSHWRYKVLHITGLYSHCVVAAIVIVFSSFLHHLWKKFIRIMVRVVNKWERLTEVNPIEHYGPSNYQIERRQFEIDSPSHVPPPPKYIGEGSYVVYICIIVSVYISMPN